MYGLGARIDMVYLTYVIYVAIFLFEHKVWLAISMSMFWLAIKLTTCTCTYVFRTSIPFQPMVAQK